MRREGPTIGRQRAGGAGTEAAKRSRNSSGSNSRAVEPSLSGSLVSDASPPSVGVVDLHHRAQVVT